jgi:hypothetical protein
MAAPEHRDRAGAQPVAILMSMSNRTVRLPDAVLRGLRKAINIQHALVASYIWRLRRARPSASPAELIGLLEKRYLATVTSSGAAAGAAAAVPGVGTGVALALGGGEVAAFFEATALFALALAEVHGVQVTDLERRQALITAVVLGDNGALLAEKLTGRPGQDWAQLLPELPISAITAINNALGPWLVRTFGRKEGLLALGRAIPFGVGAAIGAAGNQALGRAVVDTARRVFGPPPPHFRSARLDRTGGCVGAPPAVDGDADQALRP